MATAESCREMVCAILDDFPTADWKPAVTYTADGDRVLGWAYETASRTGRPVAVAFAEDTKELRLSMAATSLLHRGLEQTWCEVSDLVTVSSQLRSALEQCLNR